MAIAVNKSGSAESFNWRRGKYSIIEKVLPWTGKFFPGNHYDSLDGFPGPIAYSQNRITLIDFF